MAVARDRLLGLRSGCSSTPTSATRCCSGARPRAAAPRSGAAAGRAAVGLADRRRPRRGGGDRGQGRERARARLPARAARGDRRLRRLGRPRPPSSRARPAPTSCSSCRAAARSRPRTPPPSAAERRAARVLRRERELGARRAARAGRRRSPTRAVGYVCGQVRFIDQGGANQEGAYWRYEMAVRDARVARSPGSPPATARSTRSAATAYLPLGPGVEPRPLVPVHAHQARLARRLRAGARSPRRRWSRRSRASSPASGG